MSSSVPGAQPSGKVFVVTGANSGLGFECAKLLASESPNNTVILACRDLRKADDAVDQIRLATGNSRVDAMALDLSSLASVREFAAEYADRVGRPIDALVCNAGIPRGPARTVDGLDGVFQTNHLGHFLLTELLLNGMSPDGRILSVSSDMHQPPGPKLKWPGAEALAAPGARGVTPYLRYSYSKLANLYFVYELSRRLRAAGSALSVAAFNPGLMTDTNFASTPGPVATVMKRMFASRLGSLDASSAALAQLATTGDTAAIDGCYFDRTAAAPTRSSDLSYDIRNARDLWDVSSKLAGLSG